MAANPERGEVELVIGEEKGVICAEMGRLAALSGLCGTKTLHDLYRQISGAEPVTMYNAIATMMVKGDPKAMKEAITSPAHFQIVADAVLASLTEFLGEADGKKDGGEPGNP